MLHPSSDSVISSQEMQSFLALAFLASEARPGLATFFNLILIKLLAKLPESSIPDLVGLRYGLVAMIPESWLLPGHPQPRDPRHPDP